MSGRHYASPPRRQAGTSRYYPSSVGRGRPSRCERVGGSPIGARVPHSVVASDFFGRHESRHFSDLCGDGVWHTLCSVLLAMIPLRVGRVRESWWLRGASVAVVLLTLATGLCLFDQDEDGASHIVLPDLCLGTLAVAITVMPLAPLLAVGWAVNLPFAGAYEVALYSSDPPPKPASFL